MTTGAGKNVCTGRPVRLGRGYAEGEICGRPGRYRVGTLWLCKMCFPAVIRDAEALACADAERCVLLSRCVFPATLSGTVSAPLCGEPAVTDVGGAPVCDRHYSRALAWHREMSAREEKAEAQIEAEADRRRQEEMRTWKADGSQIIYYLRRADGAVKIGTSTEFGRRAGDLTGEYGKLELLLTHCGDYPREKETHRQFADLALGREWFRAEEPLLSWIVQVRRKRVNMLTKIPGTEPLWYIRDLLREAQAKTVGEPGPDRLP